MEVKLDLHTHTLASGHAYGTITEMAKAAGEKGLSILGITEHAAGIPGTCCDLYFKNLAVVPRQMFGVHLLLGAELNILDYKGTLSMDSNLIESLDLRIAGIHPECYTIGTKMQNTDATIGAITNPQVDIISHPIDGKIPLDYEAVCLAAREHHVLLEVNNHALRGPRMVSPEENCREMLYWCRKLELPVIMGSDAHYMTDIANYSHAQPLLSAMDYPSELILNYYPNDLLTFINSKRNA